MEILAFYFINNPPQARYLIESLTLWPVIRLVTGSRFNHVAIICRLAGELVIIEALGKGVTQTPYAEWRTRAVRKITAVPFRKDGAQLAGLLGTPYDRKTLVWYKVVKMLTGKWKGPTGDQAYMAVTCSELGAIVAGHPHPWDVSPQELYEFVTTSVPV